MTIRFYKYWNGHHPSSVATFSERTEKRLIAGGYAYLVDQYAPDRMTTNVPLTSEEQADSDARLAAELAKFD